MSSDIDEKSSNFNVCLPMSALVWMSQIRTLCVAVVYVSLSVKVSLQMHLGLHF